MSLFKSCAVKKEYLDNMHEDLNGILYACSSRLALLEGHLTDKHPDWVGVPQDARSGLTFCLCFTFLFVSPWDSIQSEVCIKCFM